MIQLVDRAVERFLRQGVPLAEGAVDLSFDAPDRDWGAALTRPTVNVFLWEVTRNPSFQLAGMQQRLAPGGSVERRPATPVVDLHYLVTTWATEMTDEHQLLGSILSCVLAHPRLPDEVLPDTLEGTRIGLSLAAAEKKVPGEFWSALDGRLKPGIQLELNLPLEVFAWQPTAPVSEEVHLRVGRQPRPATPPPEPALRRRRSGGTLVMEGRPATPSGAEGRPPRDASP